MENLAENRVTKKTGDKRDAVRVLCSIITKKGPPLRAE